MKLKIEHITLLWNRPQDLIPPGFEKRDSLPPDLLVGWSTSGLAYWSLDLLCWVVGIVKKNIKQIVLYYISDQREVLLCFY